MARSIELNSKLECYNLPLHCLDGLLDECDFIGSEGILAIELLVGYKMFVPNC